MPTAAELLAQRRKLAVARALIARGNLPDSALFEAACTVEPALSAHVVHTYPRTLRRIGIIARTRSHGRPTWAITQKGREFANSHAEVTQ